MIMLIYYNTSWFVQIQSKFLCCFIGGREIYHGVLLSLLLIHTLVRLPTGRPGCVIITLRGNHSTASTALSLKPSSGRRRASRWVLFCVVFTAKYLWIPFGWQCKPDFRIRKYSPLSRIQPRSGTTPSGLLLSVFLSWWFPVCLVLCRENIVSWKIVSIRCSLCPYITVCSLYLY